MRSFISVGNFYCRISCFKFLMQDFLISGGRFLPAENKRGERDTQSGVEKWKTDKEQSVK